MTGNGRYFLIQNDCHEDNKDLVPYRSFVRAIEFVLHRSTASVEVEVLASGHKAGQLYSDLYGEACTAA